MTNLSPLEEALFNVWVRANGSQDIHENPKNQFDFRGLYKQTNGMIHPPGHVANMANAHNAMNQPQEGGDMNFPDPYMAAAEMHKANLDSQSKQRSDALKMHMEHAKMQHKTMLEQMKLQHKSQEAEKDRAHKAQADMHAKQLEMQNRMQDRQFALEDSARARQESMQDAQMNRQHSVQDAVMQEHFARSRPQPQSKAGPNGQPGMQQEPQTTAPTGHGPQPSPLQHQLMSRAMRG